jgi:hypothetical protein
MIYLDGIGFVCDAGAPVSCKYEIVSAGRNDEKHRRGIVSSKFTIVLGSALVSK